jgi:hypothetical protein
LDALDDRERGRDIIGARCGLIIRGKGPPCRQSNGRDRQKLHAGR